MAKKPNHRRRAQRLRLGACAIFGIGSGRRTKQFARSYLPVTPPVP